VGVFSVSGGFIFMITLGAKENSHLFSASESPLLLTLMTTNFIIYKTLVHCTPHGGIWRTMHCRLCINCYGIGWVAPPPSLTGPVTRHPESSMAHPSPLTQNLTGIASKLIKESEKAKFVKKSFFSFYVLFILW